MVKTQRCLLILTLTVLVFSSNVLGGIRQPEFIGSLPNITVPIGRDATFTCVIKHLGPYRVGWVKSDTKAIQAIHDHVITHDSRVSVAHNEHYMWSLMISNVDMDDDGLYMCQINTNPMKSQTARLTVVVPPKFEKDEAQPTDINVGENGQVKLTCHARGVPPPHVLWRREDGKDIIIREPTDSTLNEKSRVTIMSEYYGEELKLTKLSRSDMTTYLCIASNGVPPAVSKRIKIHVHFAPAIHVPNQLVGAPLGTDVVLECYVEASPMSINYWIKDKGSMIISSAHHVVETIEKSTFQYRMTLTIKNLQKRDAGTYHCAAKNSLGEVESTIRLYEIPGPSKTDLATWSSYYDEYNNPRYPGQPDMDNAGKDSVFRENYLLRGSNNARRPGLFPPGKSTTSVRKIGKNRSNLKDESSQATDLATTNNILLLLLSTSLSIFMPRWLQ